MSMENRAGVSPAPARAAYDSATEPQLSVYGRGIPANCGDQGAWNSLVTGGSLKDLPSSSRACVGTALARGKTSGLWSAKMPWGRQGPGCAHTPAGQPLTKDL